MTKIKELGIWKYNKRSGYWNLERTVTADTMDNWLHIFQKDEPTETFVVSKNKPNKKPASGAATLVREVWTNTIKKRDISDVGSFNSDDHLDGSKVIGSIKGYQIFHRYDGSGSSQFGIYNPKNKKTEGAVAGTIRKGIMKDLYAANKSGLKMDELYHWLLKNGHVKAFVANDQSMGAQKMWQKLASKKNITVHGWHAGKPLNIDPNDEEETHTSVAFGRKLEPEEKMIGNTKLIATLSKRVNEDAPAVSAGSGHVAGIGVGDKGEPGNPPRSLIKRSKFAGHEVFEVDNDVYHKARLGKAKHHKYSRYVGEDEVGAEIRKYGRENPGKPIILKHNVNGALQFLKYGKY